jgi:hypothetical protein
VPRLVARLVTRLVTWIVVWLVARLVVDLVVHREYSSPLSRLQRSTSPPPRVRVPRHIARLVTRLVTPLDYSTSRRLVVDYFASAARPGASARRAARRGVRRRLLHALQLPFAATLALLQPRCASRLLVSRQHWLYFEYAARRHDVVFRSHRVDFSS